LASTRLVEPPPSHSCNESILKHNKMSFYQTAASGTEEKRQCAIHNRSINPPIRRSYVLLGSTLTATRIIHRVDFAISSYYTLFILSPPMSSSLSIFMQLHPDSNNWDPINEVLLPVTIPATFSIHTPGQETRSPSSFPGIWNHFARNSDRGLAASRRSFITLIRWSR
jgi:hypothetical protein